MPYYSRYRRRSGYSKYRRRYGYRRLAYRRRRYRTTGGSLTSRSRVRVRVQVEKLITLEIPAGKTESPVCTSVPYANYILPALVPGSQPPSSALVPGALQCSAVTSPLYQTYTKLFDQVKCDGVISKVAVTTPVGSSNSSVPALTIVTAYDRQGTFYEAAQVSVNQQGQLVQDPVTYKEVLESSGSVVRNALNNSVAKTARSCWAADLQERTMFHDCTVNDRIDDDKNDTAYSALHWSCPYFCPLFYVGFSLPTTAPTAPTPINFILSQTYYFTFRNPKYGASLGSSAAAVVREDPIEAQTLDDEGLDALPQVAIDGFARAAAATGRMVRTHGRSGLTPNAKKTRLLAEADRYDREAEDLARRYDDYDAAVSERLGTKDITRYPGSDRRILERLYNAASDRAAVAEKVRDEVHDLDTEDALSRTDTLPLS